MKPAYDQLAEEYETSSSVLIADVDCTTEAGKSVCSDLAVSGYPTIKYFTADTGKSGTDYSGGRSFDDLKSFIESELKQDCNPKTKENCNDQEKAYIDKMIEKGVEKQKAEASRLEGLADQPASTDKADWLQRRLSILQLLLGTKKVRPKKMKTTTKIAIGLGCVMVVVIGLVYWCTRSPSEVEARKPVTKTQEGQAEDKKEDESKKDE